MGNRLKDAGEQWKRESPKNKDLSALSLRRKERERERERGEEEDQEDDEDEDEEDRHYGMHDQGRVRAEKSMCDGAGH